MKSTILTAMVSFFIFSNLSSQSNFDKEKYFQFLKKNDGMSLQNLQDLYPLQQAYYMGEENSASPASYAYFDTLKTKLKLTENEIYLLKRNGFVVTERLSFSGMTEALKDFYVKDLPVFVSTDAILFALHASYDNILKETEAFKLEPNIKIVTKALYDSFPKLFDKYKSDPELQESLTDVDLYVTVALSLMTEEVQLTRVPSNSISTMLKLISDQSYAEISLFSQHKRIIDFSQFKPRGHYLDKVLKPEGQLETLEKYFQVMMWLGRIDFWLTPLDTTWKKADLKRMNMSSALLSELLDITGSRNLLDENDKILSFLVGESDNLTPTELKAVYKELSINNPVLLTNDSVFDCLEMKLSSTSSYGQRIMSDIIKCDPYAHSTKILPVSFKLLGQRFIIDSYILANVVFDRILNHGKLEVRLMPSPLDALFALGNNNALPMLENDINTYNYSLQLSALRQLVDAYDTVFWKENLYNTWLQAIRLLNPATNTAGIPFFMTTAAWQHEKMNTQLASWTQLRHDNLLYAKPSYTAGVVICSYPYSYVEPYPSFYRQIADYANSAKEFFSGYLSFNTGIVNYFESLNSTMIKLAVIADKELNDTPITENESDFLKKMISLNTGGMCGEKPINGWYISLIYGKGEETVIADIHTQPTDSMENMVGKVLHAATGKINTGIFIAKAPLPDGRLMLFTGPVMSYYELITNDFYRYTDKEWQDMVSAKKNPARPDWTNIYIADTLGNLLSKGRELPYEMKTWNEIPVSLYNGNFDALVFPIPVADMAYILIDVGRATNIRVALFDQFGKQVYLGSRNIGHAGKSIISFSTGLLKPGVYICQVKADSNIKNIKFIKE